MFLFRISCIFIFIAGTPIQVKLITTLKTITFYMKLSDTVADLKAKIKVKEGLKIEEQELTFDFQTLKDDKSLNAYNINEDSILRLSLKGKTSVNNNCKTMVQSRVCCKICNLLPNTGLIFVIWN